MQNCENAEENGDKEKKEANAFLRERFLYLISSMSGRRSTIKMYENTEVSGTIKAFDLNFEKVIVENLKTPLPDPIKFAFLRTNDILTMSFK